MPTASSSTYQRFRYYFVGIAALACMAQIGWEAFNGGVISHHILHRADLPAISNWWSLLLVPSLAWFLSGVILKRFLQTTKADENRLKMAVIGGFAGGFLIGAALSFAFLGKHLGIAGILFQGMFLAALIVPLYRAEYLLGFVLAMMFTFGAVLPTAIGCIVAAVAAIAHLLIYPCAIRVWAWVRHKF